MRKWRHSKAESLTLLARPLTCINCGAASQYRRAYEQNKRPHSHAQSMVPLRCAGYQRDTCSSISEHVHFCRHILPHSLRLPENCK